MGSGRLIITGATGFIGRRLIGHALARGYEVIALARDCSSLLRQRNERLHVKEWSVGQPLPECADVDALLHLAAYIPSDLSNPQQAAACFEINTNGALKLAMEAADRRVRRFVFFGSGQVYVPGEALASETSPAYPVHRASYYLASKLAAEICLQAFGNANSMPVTVLRLASVYGPGMHDGGMLPTFIRSLAARRPIILQQGGRYSVDLVYVDDVVSLAFQMIEMGTTGIYNAGSGFGCTSLVAARTLADALGANRTLIKIEDDGEGNERSVGFSALNVTKAVEEVGYSPRSFSEGIRAWKAARRLTDFGN